MRQRFARTPDGAQAQCDTWTSLPQQGLVYGCFISDSTLSGQLACNAGTQGLQPCLKLTTDGSIQPEMAVASASGGENPPKRESVLSPTIIALISAGAGLLLLTLALLAFCIVRRRRRSKAEVYAVTALLDPALSTSEEKGSRKADEKTKRKADEKTNEGKADEKWGEAGGRGGAARKYPRVSSQYTVDSMQSGDEADSPMNDPQLPLGTFVIKSSYTPTLADEIMVYPGDTVKVYQEFDDGWCSAVNLSRGFTRGVIPINCIDPTSGRAAE